VIGASGDQEHGAAYVWQLESGKWVEQQKLVPSSPTGISNKFGESVSIDTEAHVLTVGAPNDSEAGFESGAIYLYAHDDARPEVGWQEI